MKKNLIIWFSIKRAICMEVPPKIISAPYYSKKGAEKKVLMFILIEECVEGFPVNIIVVEKCKSITCIRGEIDTFLIKILPSNTIDFLIVFIVKDEALPDITGCGRRE